jgi:hypothetical protein
MYYLCMSEENPKEKKIRVAKDSPAPKEQTIPGKIRTKIIRRACCRKASIDVTIIGVFSPTQAPRTLKSRYSVASS